VIFIDKTKELICRALIIGEKYSKSDKPTKIAVGEVMLGKIKVNKKKKTYR
jgi:DNA-directed RNA polymerase subunit K/omega